MEGTENTQDGHSHAFMSTARIEALADGLFSIAMTLLALNIAVPVIAPPENAAALLPRKLLDLFPAIALYAVSFVVLGIYWVAHHGQFRVIDAADRPFLWINILFMMLIALAPAVCAVAIVVAFVSPLASIVMYALLPPFYIAPAALDRFVFRRERRV